MAWWTGGHSEASTTGALGRHLHEKVGVPLAEAEAVGYGFDLPKNRTYSKCSPKTSVKSELTGLDNFRVVAIRKPS